MIAINAPVIRRYVLLNYVGCLKFCHRSHNIIIELVYNIYVEGAFNIFRSNALIMFHH